jgi:integrase
MAKTKPEKPRPDFPLFAHNAGVWAKKVRGKLYYFGPWDDPNDALRRWNEQKDYLLAGQIPPSRQPSLSDLLNSFVGSKETLYTTGAITWTTYHEYQAVCDAIADTLERSRPIESLIPSDFDRLRVALAKSPSGKTYSPATLKRRLAVARMLFAFANDELGINLRYKRQLASPPKRLLRQAERERGKLLYAAADIRKLVKNGGAIKGMILLGINAAYGAQDCCLLQASHIRNGWATFPRTKTGVDRRARLWPETIKALKITSGPVFNGRMWNRAIVAGEFKKVCEKAGVANLGHYSLRRTFETIGTTAKVSQSAIDLVMGHSDGSMGGQYRQQIFDSQLIELSDHVRAWYLGKISIS